MMSISGIRESKRKCRPVAMFTMILFLQIIGCNRNSHTAFPPSTPTVLALTEVYGVMPTRYKVSENIIAATVEFKGIRFIKQPDKLLDSRRIKLVVHFKNLSTNPVVLRKPTTYGFVGVNPCVNDLEIKIEMKDGPKMNVTAISNYPCSLESVSFPKTRREDFIKIDPGDVFSYPIEVVPPGVLIEETKYVGNLPPGRYKLQVEYRNIDIGYRLPLEVTPPASFKNRQAELEWYDNHTMVVDLNAWVGHNFSNEVEFEVPAS